MSKTTAKEIEEIRTHCKWRIAEKTPVRWETLHHLLDDADELRRIEGLLLDQDDAVQYLTALTTIDELRARIAELEAGGRELVEWITDLQSGMYINCVYCGHRYGPDDEVPATMADVLKEHVEQCPKHPMSALKAHIAELEAAARELVRFWSSVPPTGDLSNWFCDATVLAGKLAALLGEGGDDEEVTDEDE